MTRRRTIPGRSYNPTDNTHTPSWTVERDPTHHSFNTQADAEAWAARLDNPDDLAPTAHQATHT